MRAQRQAAGILGMERLHELGPEQAGGPQLGDLHEEVHTDAEEETDPRSESVDVEPHPHAGPHVLQAVRQGVGKFQVSGRPGFLHVVAAHRDRVELGHALAGVAEDVSDDAQGRPGRVDVGVAHHELFEDVVLDGARQLLGGDALLLRSDDVERQDGEHRPVHGHGDAHLVQRDLVEEHPHVEDRIDRHARHTHISDHARVIRVVAAVRRQIEGDGQALLAGGEVAAVEGVALLGR